ncbi:MAG: hypothetical protein N2748_02050, partial [candidate division WOR-3 bacterium]|nr:hypothetical protein [candidate division WOR-3 bacterium]
MLKINMFTLCLLLVWSVGFSSNLNMKFSPNNRIIYFKYPFYKNSFSPDIGIWVTQRFFMHLLPQVIDTLDIAQVEFDSSNFGLDADTCWIDNLVMNKVGDSLTGFYYMLFEENGFLYNLNHRYTFRVKGKGNIPSLTDTMRSVINSLSVIAPQANDIIYRGKELIIHWTPSNEHNILIELIDFNYNMLFYYPVLDIGSFTIPSADIDSLNTGPIIFCIGRLNFKMEFFPGFPLFAITALIHQIPLELQEIPAIAENANSDQHIR